MRFRDIKNHNKPDKKNREEDKICPLLFFLKLKFYPLLNQFGIYYKETLLARADLHLITEVEQIEHVFIKHPLMAKMYFDLEKAKQALTVHVERIKYIETEQEKKLCRFAEKENNKILCTCCISCKYREWDYEESLPICKHANTYILPPQE